MTENMQSIIGMQSKGIGASRAIWVVTDPLKLYNNIKGLAERFEGNRETRKGLLYEPGIYQTYVDKFQHKDSVSEYQPSCKISNTPFLYCHADGLETDQDGNNWILEIKKINNIQKIWTAVEDYNKISEVKPAWYFQNLHQLYCYPDCVGVKQIILDEMTGEVHVCELIVDDEIKEDIKKLIKKEIKFWFDSIMTNTPPPAIKYDVVIPSGETEMPEELQDLHIQIVEMQTELKTQQDLLLPLENEIEKLKTTFKDSCKSQMKKLFTTRDGKKYVAAHNSRPGNLLLNVDRLLANGYVTQDQINECKEHGKPIDKWNFKETKGKKNENRFCNM